MSRKHKTTCGKLIDVTISLAFHQRTCPKCSGINEEELGRRSTEKHLRDQERHARVSAECLADNH